MQGAMILMIGTMTVKVVSMLFKIPISNLLGGTGYSYFTNAYEIFNLISTIATAGFPVAISKLVSENGVLGNYRDNHKIFRISRTFFLITGLLCMAVMILGAGSFAAMIPNPGAKLSIICLAPAVLTCCLMSAYRGYYQGMQNMYPTSISQIIEAVTKMIFGLGFSGGVMYLTQREYSLHATVLGLASIFIALTGTTNSLLQAVGRVSLPVKLILIGSAIKLAMNYLLVGIPQLNIQAAPWSTLVCYVVITLLSLIALRSTVGPLGAFGVFGKPLLAGLLCAAFARLTQNMLMQVTASRFAVLLSAAVGAAVYLVGLLLLRALKKEDIMMLPKGEKMAKILEKYSLLG